MFKTPREERGSPLNGKGGEGQPSGSKCTRWGPQTVSREEGKQKAGAIVKIRASCTYVTCDYAILHNPRHIRKNTEKEKEKGNAPVVFLSWEIVGKSQVSSPSKTPVRKSSDTSSS